MRVQKLWLRFTNVLLTFLLVLFCFAMYSTPVQATTITPTAVESQVNASTDDVNVYSTSDKAGWLLNAVTTANRAGYSDVTQPQRATGLRFNSITVPQGAYITHAYLNLTCDSPNTATTVSMLISGQAADNATTFTTTNDYILRRGIDVGGANNNNLTLSNINWDNPPAWIAETVYQSPDVRTIIQEIVNRAGWVENNSLVLFWDDCQGYSTEVANNTLRRCYSYDGSSSKAPLLHIEYVTDSSYFGIENPYIGGTLYKAQLHAHSDASYDGTGTAYNNTVAWRDIGGVDALALTNHWVYTPDPGVSNIVWIPAEEQTVNGSDGGLHVPHFNVYNITGEMGGGHVLPEAQTLINTMNAAGAFGGPHHPDMTVNNGSAIWTAQELRFIKDYQIFELYNSDGQVGRGDTTYKYGFALTHSANNSDTNKIWCVTGSDYHGTLTSVSQAEDNVYVYATSKTATAIEAAIISGNMKLNTNTGVRMNCPRCGCKAQKHGSYPTQTGKVVRYLCSRGHTFSERTSKNRRK